MVLFGACDRHNLGDLLFPHLLAARYAGRPIYFAGLVECDLRADGGHRAVAIHRLTEILHGQKAELVHVGGVALADCSNAMRDEVFTALHHADAVTVRDRRTQAALAQAGIDATLQPDAVSAIATQFGARIRERVRQVEVRACAKEFPQGYLAVQFAAEYGDDAMLYTTTQLVACAVRTKPRMAVRIAHATSVAMYRIARAGHRTFGEGEARRGAVPRRRGAVADELEVYQRLAHKLTVPCRVFESLNI